MRPESRSFGRWKRTMTRLSSLVVGQGETRLNQHGHREGTRVTATGMHVPSIANEFNVEFVCTLPIFERDGAWWRERHRDDLLLMKCRLSGIYT